MAAIIQLFERTRRRDCRVALDMPVVLVHESGIVAVASGLNVSASGIQIACSRLMLDSLYRSDLPVAADLSHLDAHFMLPLFKEAPKVDARCDLIHKDRRTSGELLLGLEFVQLWVDSGQLLAQFLGEPPKC